MVTIDVATGSFLHGAAPPARTMGSEGAPKDEVLQHILDELKSIKAIQEVLNDRVSKLETSKQKETSDNPQPSGDADPGQEARGASVVPVTETDIQAANGNANVGHGDAEVTASATRPVRRFLREIQGPLRPINDYSDFDTEYLQSEYKIIADSLQKTRLHKDLKLNDTRAGIKRQDQPIYNILTKSARYTETILKLIAHLSGVSDSDTEDLFVVASAQLN